MKDKIIRFMQGRYGAYGPDSLNRFLLFGALAAMILSIFLRGNILYFVAMAALVYAYFRMLSKNYGKRSGENQLFLKCTAGLREKLKSGRSRMQASKTHHIFKCPGCGQKVRVPRGKGKIAIHCPKCGNEFIKKS